MKAAELRQLSEEDLKSKIQNLEENLFRLKCNKTIGQLDDTSALKSARRDIARAKTILRESLEPSK
ncbi:MAG: 50S ribosomal protein L29 [Proteobacteria bacterium]|nr:50S ribosomal protein L29 [Pseudomonadota bacterium]